MEKEMKKGRPDPGYWEERAFIVETALIDLLGVLEQDGSSYVRNSIQAINTNASKVTRKLIAKYREEDWV